MSDIVERLHIYARDDHERLCQGREYTCTCGHDNKRDPLLTEAADEITRLRAQIEDLTRLHDDAADTVEEVRAQNAELLEALRSIAKTTYGYEPGVWTDEEARNYFSSLFFGAQAKARAAIAKVEKETSE